MQGALDGWPAGIWALAAVFLGAGMTQGAQAGEAKSAVVIGQSQLGHVYLQGEPLVFPVTAVADRVEWAATDLWGTPAGHGDAAAASDKATLCLPALPPGHYTIDVTAQREGRQVGAARAQFLVVSPLDLSKITGSPFGVMTHFAQGWEPDLIEPLSRAGIKHVRDEVYWDAIEKEVGEFTFPDRFERYMEALREHHMVPLVPMSFGNELHYDVPGVPMWAAAPYTEAQHAAYARYCQEVLRQYPQVRFVEIWNEYNGDFAKGPADGKPEVYAAMLKQAYRAVKAQDAEVQVLGCATIGVPIHWIEQVFKADGLAHMDVVSVHPYGFLNPPESLVPSIEALRELIRKYNGGKDKPIWATEQGYYLAAPGSHGNRDPITEHTKACYLVRAWTLFMAHGIEKTFWYLGRNDPHFGTMGLMGKPDDPDGRYAPRPALAAYATLVRALNDAAFEAKEEAPAGVFSMRFARPGGQTVRVMWATTPADVALVTAKPLAVTDLSGREVEVHPMNGSVHLRLSEAPLFVVGGADAVQPSTRISAIVPALAAHREAMPVELRINAGDLPASKLRFIAGRECDEFAVDGAAEAVSRLAVQINSDSGEQWTPLSIEMDGRIVYTGQARTLALPALRLDPFPRLEARDRLAMRVVNTSAIHTFRVTAARWTVGEAAGEQTIARTIAPASEELIELAITAVDPMRLYPVAIELTIEDAPALTLENEASFNPVARRNIQIDGDLSEWNDLPAIDLDDVRYRKLLADRTGPDDLGGWLRLAWDEEHLYLAAAITDDIFDQAHRGDVAWKGDNIQLGISADAPWTDGEWPNRSLELGLSLAPGGEPEVFRTAGSLAAGPVADARLVVRRDEVARTTFYECALPWSALDANLSNSGMFSFGMFVNDADGAGRKGYLQWGDIKRLDRMQPMRLVQ